MVLFILREAFNSRERRELLNRLMARDYAQYRYFEDKWKPDLKAIEDIRKEDKAAAKAPAKAKKEGDLSMFEEPWDEEDS